jgi:hypothetical protein
MLGGFGFRRSSMEDHLIHGIRYAIWHDDWCNDQHDDFVVVIARMLQWQLLCQCQRQRPFHGRNLFALIVIGLLNMLLDGLPYDKKGRFTKMPNTPEWRKNAGEAASNLAKEVYGCLSDAEQTEFEAFQQQYLAMYAKQMKRRQDRPLPN